MDIHGDRANFRESAVEIRAESFAMRGRELLLHKLFHAKSSPGKQVTASCALPLESSDFRKRLSWVHDAVMLTMMLGGAPLVFQKLLGSDGRADVIDEIQADLSR